MVNFNTFSSEDSDALRETAYCALEADFRETQNYWKTINY